MPNLLSYIEKVNSIWTIAAFAIAIVYYLVLKGKQKNWIMFTAIIVILIIGLAPIFLDSFFKNAKVYRLRITVLGINGTPIEDSKVWSTIGGEPKKVPGGWEIDVMPQMISTEKKVTLFASVDNSFLSGNKEVQLNDDYNPNEIIQLKRDTSSKIGGKVANSKNEGLAGLTTPKWKSHNSLDKRIYVDKNLTKKNTDTITQSVQKVTGNRSQVNQNNAPNYGSIGGNNNVNAGHDNNFYAPLQVNVNKPLKFSDSQLLMLLDTVEKSRVIHHNTKAIVISIVDYSNAPQLATQISSFFESNGYEIYGSGRVTIFTDGQKPIRGLALNAENERYVEIFIGVFE